MKVQFHDSNEQISNSDITLESKTFNRVLLYILMQELQVNENNQPFDTGITEQLDQVIQDSKKEFEEALSLIDKRL